MKTSRALSAVLLLAACCGRVVNAQVVQNMPNEPTAGVVSPRYTGLRIGDAAPQFALPDANGKLWSSREQLGQQAVLLLLVGQSPVLVGEGITPQTVVASIAQAAEQLRPIHVTTVVVSKATGIELAGINAQFDALNLRDERGELHQLFQPDPTGLTLVGIDRAGFLRRIERMRDLKALGAAMLQIGDYTPALEEGKPAPDFSISDTRGRVRRLSELRGRKNLLLTFFPKCFTGGCANHLTSLRDAKTLSASNDTEIWAVSVDPAEGERGQIAFAAYLGLDFPLIPDTGRNVSILYGAGRRYFSTALRRTVLIDRDGIVRHIARDVDVYKHGLDMVAKMRELGMMK
jgi:peroxiredoxin